MESDLEKLKAILRVVVSAGFVASGVLIVGISYKLFEERFPGNAKKYKWIFAVIALFLLMLFVFIYYLLFVYQPSEVLIRY
jgi:hypothetical protein